jgi:hypothetical protein
MIAGAVLALVAPVALLVRAVVAVVRNDGYGQRPQPPRLGTDLGPR